MLASLRVSVCDNF